MSGSRNQTCGSRGSVRFAFGARRMRWSWLPLACALSGACSLMVESSQRQCATDNDCWARGLPGTACVASLCQAILPASGTGGINEVVAGSGGADAGTAGKSGSESVDTGAPDSVAMNAGAGSGNSSSAGKGGVSGASSGGAGMASAGVAGCSGASCPECVEDKDCEMSVGANATCIDKKCFAPEPQCEADADCVARGPEYMGGRCAGRQCLPNPKWRCEPVPVPSPTETVELRVPIIDALALTYVSNIALVACNKNDLACDSPVVRATSGMDGRAVLKVPANFAGYLQQTESRSYGPGLYFPPALLPVDMDLRNFPIFQVGAAAGLGLALGAALDPQRGHIMLVSEDCMGYGVPGVVFSSAQADARTVQFYVRDQTPTTSVMDTPAEGTGGFMNLPPGVVVINAKEMKSGIELATASVLIRAGFISMSYIRPMSRGATMTGVGGH